MPHRPVSSSWSANWTPTWKTRCPHRHRSVPSGCLWAGRSHHVWPGPAAGIRSPVPRPAPGRRARRTTRPTPGTRSRPLSARWSRGSARRRGGTIGTTTWSAPRARLPPARTETTIRPRARDRRPLSRVPEQRGIPIGIVRQTRVQRVRQAPCGCRDGNAAPNGPTMRTSSLPTRLTAGTSCTPMRNLVGPGQLGDDRIVALPGGTATDGNRDEQDRDRVYRTGSG